MKHRNFDKAMFPAIATCTQSLGVLTDPLSSHEDRDNVIQFQVLCGKAKVALRFFPGELLRLGEVPGLVSFAGRFCCVMVLASRKAGHHFISLFCPHTLGAFRLGLTLFRGVFVPPGALVAKSSALVAFREFLARLFAMGSPVVRVILTSKRNTQTGFAACFGGLVSDLRRRTIKLFAANGTSERTSLAFRWHVINPMAFSENRVNCGNLFYYTGSEYKRQSAAKPVSETAGRFRD
jgi:hypothetical protein